MPIKFLAVKILNNNLFNCKYFWLLPLTIILNDLSKINYVRKLPVEGLENSSWFVCVIYVDFILNIKKVVLPDGFKATKLKPTVIGTANIARTDAIFNSPLIQGRQSMIHIPHWMGWDSSNWYNCFRHHYQIIWTVHTAF